MYPHERSLVKKMEGKPFVLIGVNSDQTRAIAKQATVTEKLTWRSFYAGQGGGEAAKTYQVQGWPSLFLIDHKGVIKQKWVGSPGNEVLDKAVEKLVDDAKSDLARESASKPKPEPSPESTKPAPVEKPVSDPERLEKVAASKLSLAKQLADDGNTDKAKQRFQEIIKNYPNTKAAKEAKQLLDK